MVSLASIVGKPINTNQGLKVYNVLLLMCTSVNFILQFESSQSQSVRVLAKFRKSCFVVNKLNPTVSLGLENAVGRSPGLRNRVQD